MRPDETAPGLRADVAVIGAGPAGLAAAAAAARLSSNVVLVDAGARVGGQYWRHRAEDTAPQAPAPRWHHGWDTFTGLRRDVENAAADGRLTRIAATHVWALDAVEGGGFTLHTSPAQESWSVEAAPAEIAADTVVLAPGAYDRQLPVPGWTLPGVMAAGGIQAFVKVQGVAPGRRVLLAGTGPFLLAAAATVLQAGAEVVAVCESTDLTGWLPRGAAAGLVPSKGMEGAEYAALLVRHRVPYLLRRVVTEIRGEDRVRGVVTARAGRDGAPVAGSERVFDDVDVVGLGWGFVPQAELLLQSGAQTRLDADRSLVGVVSDDQASTVPGLYLAGEITGVTGAIGAVAEGRIAGAAAAAHATGRPRPAHRSAAATRARHRLFGGAMAHAHPAPQGWQAWVEEDTTVCRCEEVPYGEVVAARDELDLPDPRSLKGQTRAGMGLCQGRICGFAMTCIAAAGDRPPSPAEAARQVARRPLGVPITLGALLGDAPAPADRTGEHVVAEPLPRSDDRT